MEKLILIQILTTIVHAFLLSLEKRYCGHNYWWNDATAYIFLVMSFIPLLGILSAIAASVDYIQNILVELRKR